MPSSSAAGWSAHTDDLGVVMLLCTVDVLGVGVTDDIVDGDACWYGAGPKPSFTGRLAGTGSGVAGDEGLVKAAGASGISTFSSDRRDFGTGTFRPDAGVGGIEVGVSGFGTGFIAAWAVSAFGVTSVLVGHAGGAVSIGSEVDGGSGGGSGGASTMAGIGFGGDDSMVAGGSPVESTELGYDAVSADSGLTGVVVVLAAHTLTPTVGASPSGATVTGFCGSGAVHGGDGTSPRPKDNGSTLTGAGKGCGELQLSTVSTEVSIAAITTTFAATMTEASF